MTTESPLGGASSPRFRRWGKLLWALLLGVSSNVSPLPAQEAPVLTLAEALDGARQHNPDYRIALNDLELSGIGRKEAVGAFLPNLNFQAGTGLSFDRQLVSTDFFGNPIENPITEWKTSSSSSQYLGGSLTLFEGGQRFSQLRAEGAQAGAREATAVSRLRSLEAEVIRTYFRAQALQATLRVEEELLEGRQLDLEMTRRMYDLAGATRVEVLAAELNLQRQEQRIQQSVAQLRQGLLGLKRTIADPDLGVFGISDSLPEPLDPASLDPEALVDQARTSNPQILLQAEQLEVAQAQASVARGSRWPTVTMSFGFGQRTYASERSALLDPWPHQARYGTTNFSLTFPLFSRFQTQARVVEAEVAMQNARENLRKTRLQVEEEVRSRLIALETAYQGYQIALRSREIAEERLRLALEQFRLGSRTFNELQRDIDDGAAAEREVINQLVGFLEARVNLEETVGSLDIDSGIGSTVPAGASGGNSGPSREG
jgi:outer membrane protein